MGAFEYSGDTNLTAVTAVDAAEMLDHVGSAQLADLAELQRRWNIGETEAIRRALKHAVG